LVPNGGHRLDAPAYKRRYPDIKVLTPIGNRKKVEEKVAVDGGYEDMAADSAVRLYNVPGTKDREGAMVVTSSDGATVVLNDIVFNMDKKSDFLGWMFTTMFGSAPGPRVSRLAKWMLVTDANAVREELGRLADTPQLQRLVVSHEKVAHGAEAASALREAMGYL
jgi:hypothetical protein